MFKNVLTTQRLLATASAAMLGVPLLSSPAQAATIGVQFIGDGRATMASDDLAGAPGVRTGNWNNLSGASLDDTAIDSGGAAIGGGFTVTPQDTSFGNRGSAAGLDNDELLFNSIKDVSGTYTVSVTNVPYALYDVYVYMRDDSDDRAGSFTIDSTTYYVRGLTDSEGGGDPDSTGADYVLSSDTTVDLTSPNTVSVDNSIDQGNYVVFSGLTQSDFDLIAGAVDTSDAANRNKFAGFQIVEVPEPGSLALLGLGTLLIARRRRDR